MSEVQNTDVYKNLKKQKRKSILYVVFIVSLLAVMALLSVYFIVFDNIDSFLDTVQNNDPKYEIISDNKGFSYKINDKEALLTEYNGSETVVTIPESVKGTPVTHIESFINKNVTEITIPDSVLYIENKAFYHLDKLKTVKGGKFVCNIGDSAFKGCTSLENITFYENLITIENEAFCNTNLKTIVLPSNMSCLNKRAFNSCRNLQEVTMSAGIYIIEDQCFKNCKKLTTVKCYGGTMSFEDEIFTNCNKNLTIYCLPGSDMELYCKNLKIATKEIKE